MPLAVKSNKTGTTYYLHSKETPSRGGSRILYFFKKEVSSNDGFKPLDALPEGRMVTESPVTGLPLLKRAEEK